MELKESRRAFFPVSFTKYTNGQLLITLTAFLVGLLIVTQIRGQANVSHQLSSQTEEDLGNIIRELNFESDSLQRDVSESTVQLLKYNQAAENTSAVVATSQENLEKLRIMVGNIPVRGPGVIITIKDNNSMLTSYDILDLIQELKAAGAEAIAVNGVRVTNRTSFTKGRGAIFISHNKIYPPYKVKAIGESMTLASAVTLLGGIRDTLSNFEGVTVSVTESKDVKIEPRPQISPFVYAEMYDSKKD